MTATLTSTEPADQAPAADSGSLIPLATGELACSDCGQAVRDDGERVTVTVYLAAQSPNGPSKEQVLSFGRCPACAERRALVAEVVAAHPALGGRLGPAGALDRLGAALAVHAAIGEPLPSAETLTGSVELVSALIRHLAPAGNGLRWSLRYDGERAGTGPWDHLPDSQLAAARKAYVAMLSERRQAVDGAVWVAPPDAPDADLSGACLLCGRDLVLAQSGGADAWSPTVISTPSVIAAPTSPESLKGWVCAPCMSACQHVGSVGQAAMMRALEEELRTSGDEDGSARLQRLGDSAWLVSWAAVVLRERRAGRPVPGPNREPWGHISMEV
ncbi:hypothetical protein [Micropruina sp.]|uniref:hypothetical protein n=1 Tax=Micropruina sp. TaxID=2737536 RepID=UPI0039E500A5